MSERRTKRWTANAEGAFGATGAKGDRGEAFMCKVFESWNWEFEHFPSSFSEQAKGVDFSFRDPSWSNSYTADIKANLNQYGEFFVETDDTGWLFNPKKVSDRIWHVNPETGWMAWYSRSDMKRYVQSKKLRNTGLLSVQVRDKLDFISRRKYNEPQSEVQFEDVPY